MKESNTLDLAVSQFVIRVLLSTMPLRFEYPKRMKCVLSTRNPFQVPHRVVLLVAVLVIYLGLSIRIRNERLRDQTLYKHTATNTIFEQRCLQIPI